VPNSLIEGLKHVLLDDSLDMDLRAELLTPPGFNEVANTHNNVDVLAVEHVRDYLRNQIGLSLFAECSAVYEELWYAEDHSMNGYAYGRRKLRNLCLWFLMKANEEASLMLCQKQFNEARTMTDQIASFGLLVNSFNDKARSEAIASFYKQWAKDELVVEKWFAIQSTSEQPDSLNTVKKLLEHPDFNIKNPNKVRSVVGAFCLSNPRNFHRPDGTGYAFLTEQLIIIDKINSQIAARLATPLTRWHSFDKPRQALLKQQLEQLAALKLSQDLREIVNKSLNLKNAVES
jgi:aminopeptidase N